MAIMLSREMCKELEKALKPTRKNQLIWEVSYCAAPACSFRNALPLQVIKLLNHINAERTRG